MDMLKYGVMVEAYHCDNRIFKAHKWVEECVKLGQGLSYSGVGAHHQNAIVERRIKELQELARTMLSHANRRWPRAVNAHLWPYAVRMANIVLNVAPSMQDRLRRSPEQLLSKSHVNMNIKHFKPMLCPVCALDNNHQGKE